jgi:sugar lactone lactonase YvrE
VDPHTPPAPSPSLPQRTAVSGAQFVVPARAINGERPGWDMLRKRLYWVDMRKPSLHAFDPGTGATLEWAMPAWIGCYGIARDGRLVVALRTGFALFDPGDGTLRPLAPAPYDARRYCLNDGRCDRQGRLVVGSMSHPLGPPPDRPEGQGPGAPLLRYHPAHGLHTLPLPPVHIANGLAFSPDGRTLYHSDTARKTIWACDYDPETGHASRQRVFAHVDDGGDHGGPDGATVDSEGFYLCAVFGGGCLLRFDPDGRLERRIALPVRYPTMPALGGDGFSTLYVTTASFPDRQRPADASPHDGGLFALEAPAPGLPTDYMDLPKDLP